MRVLINLIGGQNFPNFYCSTKYKFDKIINIYSDESIKPLNNLNICIQNTLGIKPIEKRCDAFNIDLIKECCRNILRDHIKDEIYLNYTGGTKQMSIASYDVFRDYAFEMIYVDSQSGNFLIHSKSGEVTTVPMKFKVSVETYLRLTGNNVKGKNLNEDYILKRKELTYWLLNYLKANYEEKGTKALTNLRTNFSSVVGNNYRQKNWKEIKTQFFKGETEINTYFGSGSGGWFEEWTYLKLRDTKYFDNLEINLKLPKNEFDIFAIHDGILNLFECKTSLAIENTDLTKTYSNAKRYGGIYGRGFLVCLMLNSPMKELAEDLGLTVIEALKVDNVSEKIKSKKNIAVTR